MSDQRIILANGSRLLREMLNRILQKTDNIQVVQEVSDHRSLPMAIEKQDADWVLMSIPEGNPMPKWTHEYMLEHPSVRIMAVATDGSWIRMKWLESHEENLADLSLKDLIHILESNPGHA